MVKNLEEEQNPIASREQRLNADARDIELNLLSNPLANYEPTLLKGKSMDFEKLNPNAQAFQVSQYVSGDPTMRNLLVPQVTENSFDDRGAISRFGQSLMSGVIDTGGLALQGISEAVAAGTATDDNYKNFFEDFASGNDSTLWKAGQAVRDANREWFGEVDFTDDDWVDDLGYVFGNLGGFIGAGVAGTAVGGPLAGIGMMAALGGGMAAGDMAERARSLGYDEYDIEFSKAVGASFGLGMAEALPIAAVGSKLSKLSKGGKAKTAMSYSILGKIIGKNPIIEGVAKKMGNNRLAQVTGDVFTGAVSGAFLEGGQEYAQAIAQDYIEQMFLDPEKTIGWAENQYEGILGGIAGGTLTAIVYPFAKAKTRRIKAAIDAEKEIAEGIDNIGGSTPTDPTVGFKTVLPDDGYYDMEAEEELDPFGFDTVELTPFDDNGPDWRPKTTDDDIDDGSHIDVYDLQGRKKRGRVIERDTKTGAVLFEIDGEEHILGFDYELVDPLGDDFELATIDGEGTRIKVKDLSDDQILAFLEDRRRSIIEIKEARATNQGAYYSKMREGFALKKEAEKRGIYKKPTAETKAVKETVEELDPKDIADTATVIDTQQQLNRIRPSVQRAVASNKEAKSQSALRTRLKDQRRSRDLTEFPGKIAFIGRDQAQKLIDQFGGETGFIDETKMAIRSNQSLYPGVIKNKGTLQNEGQLIQAIKVSDRKGKLTLGADDLDIIKSYLEEGANAIPILLDPNVPYTQEIAKIDEYSDEILDFYLPDGSKLQYDKRSWSNTFGEETEKVVKKKSKGPKVPTKSTPKFGPFGDALDGKVIGTENVPDFALGYAKEILEKLNMKEDINIFFYTDKDTQKNGKIKAEVLEKHNVQPRLSRKAFINREAKRLNMTIYQLYNGSNETALTKIKEQYEKYAKDYILDSGADNVYGFVNQFGPDALENHTYKIFVNTSMTRGERAKVFPGIQNADLQRSTEDLSILNTVAHEVGHILEWELFNNATDVEKVAVLRDYYAYLSEGDKVQNLEFNKSNVSRKLMQMLTSENYKAGTSRAVVNLRAVQRDQGLRNSDDTAYLLKDGTIDVDSIVADLNRISNFEFKQDRFDNKVVDKNLGTGKYGVNYQLSFSEWFAEQTARWSMERIPPKTMSEKFFKRVSEIWEKIFATTKATPGFKFLMDNRASNKIWRSKFINQRAPPALRPRFSDNNPVGFTNFSPFKGEQALRAKFDEETIEDALDQLRDSYEVENENLLYIPNMRMWPFRIEEQEFLEDYRPEDSNAGIMTNSEINLFDESDPRVIKALNTDMGGGPLSLGTEGRAEYVAKRNLIDKNDNTADIIVKNVPVDWVLAQISSWSYMGVGARRKPLGKWKLTDSQQMNVDELTKSIKEKGFFDDQPSFITINSKNQNTKRQKHVNVIVSEGNHRALAAKAAGLKVMPVQFKWYRGAEESMNDTSDYKSNFTLDDLKELIQPKISIEIENSSEADMMLEAGLPISRIIEDPEIVEAVKKSVERTEAEAKVIVDEMTEEEKLAAIAEPIVPDETGVESDSSDGDGTSSKKKKRGLWSVAFLRWVQSPLKLWGMRNPDGTYMYPRVRKAVEKFQFNAQSVTSKMSRIFKRYNTVWRKVPEAERADVSAVIVEGDRQGKKYSLEELQEGIVIGDKTIKLSKEGIDGYNETRNTLDELGTLINEHNDNIRPKATKRLNQLLAEAKEIFDSLETPEFKGVTKVEIVERIKDPKTKKIVGYVVALPNGWSMKFTAKDFPGVDIKNGKQLENLIMESDGVKAAQDQAAAKAKADFEAERAEIDIIESLKEREEIYNQLKRVYRTPKLRNAEKARLREENINRLNDRIREIEKEIGFKRGYKGSNPYQLELNRIVTKVDIENFRIKPEFDIKTNDGYLPHIWFGSHSVRIVSADGKVKNIFSEQGYFDTDAQARQAAENFIEANPKYKDDKIVVVNRGTTWADSANNRTILSDDKIEALAVSITADQLEAAKTGRQSLAQIAKELNVKMDDRRVTASFERERLGAEGYSTDTQKILGSHIQNVMRFLILDEMKYDANELQQELDKDKNPASDIMKEEFRDFINDISNVEGGFENHFDSFFDSFFNTIDGSIDTLTKGKVKGLDRATLYSGMTGLGAAGVVGIFGAPVIGLLIAAPLGLMVYGRVKASSDAGIVSKGGTTKLFDPTVTAILGISAHTKLGMFLNLLSPIVNLSQTIINTSALYSYSEIVQSFGILSRYSRGKMTGTDTEFTTMWDERFDEGGVDVDQGLFTDGTEMNLDRGTIAKYSMFLFQKAEVFNRMMAYTAGHTRATNNGKTEKQARFDGQKAWNDTQFFYDKSDTSRILRIKGLKVGTQFKNFLFKQTAFTLGIWKEAGSDPFNPNNRLEKDDGTIETAEEAIARIKEMRKVMFKQLLHIYILAGALGLPGLQALDWLFRSLFGDENSPIKYLMRVNLDAHANGEATGMMADIFMKGLPTLVGQDISSRVGLGNRFIPYNDRLSIGDNLMDQFKGPFISTLINARKLQEAGATFGDQTVNITSGIGKPLKGIEMLAGGQDLAVLATTDMSTLQLYAETVMKNLASPSNIVYTSGYKSGQVVSNKVSRLDVFNYMIGGRPTKFSLESDLNELLMFDDNNLDRETKKVYTDMAYVYTRYAKTDPEKFREELNRIRTKAREDDIPINNGYIRRMFRNLRNPRAINTVKKLRKSQRPEYLKYIKDMK